MGCVLLIIGNHYETVFHVFKHFLFHHNIDANYYLLDFIDFLKLNLLKMCRLEPKRTR